LFNVTGGGEDIWLDADEFHFVYQGLNGDGEIRARVVGLQATASWAKAGVMFRENLTAGSRHAYACVTAGNGTGFQRRVTTGDYSTHTGGPFAAAPYWVRLVRSGNVFTGYTSADGNSWVTLGSETMPLSNQIYVGLAVTAHNDATTNLAVFDNVAVTGVILAKTAAKTKSLVAVTPSPQISAPIVQGQKFSFSFIARKGQAYVIEATTDLKSSWLPIFTNTATNDVFDFAAPMTNQPLRFYRVKVP
jgi:regulation of enolase protein 1 (concanavalin A-like superfamily)